MERSQKTMDERLAFGPRLTNWAQEWERTLTLPPSRSVRSSESPRKPGQSFRIQGYASFAGLVPCSVEVPLFASAVALQERRFPSSTSSVVQCPIGSVVRQRQ